MKGFDKLKISLIRKTYYELDKFTGPKFKPGLPWQEPQSAEFKVYIAKLELFRIYYPYVGPLSLDQIHENTNISKQKLQTLISEFKKDGYLKVQEEDHGEFFYMLEPTEKLIIEVLDKYAWTAREIESVDEHSRFR